MSGQLKAPLLLLVLTMFACGEDPAVGTGSFDGGDPDVSDGAVSTDVTEDPVADPDSGADLSEADDLSELGPDASDSSSADAEADLAPIDWRECRGALLDHTIAGEWEHSILTGAIAWQEPGHSVEDLIATRSAATAEVEGKFAYGVFGNDLQDEDVTAFIYVCDGWEELGTDRTDSDGRVRFEVPEARLPGPGRYAVRMIVEGDGSEANGWLLSVPAGTQLVVFDIDGTLTTSDSELLSDYFADLFGGDFVPEAYEGAVDVVTAHVEAGWEIIYLTARPYWLDRITRGWLDDLGFPVGTLHLTRTLSESLPTEGGTGAYKRDYLLGVDTDHDVPRAYGNSDTDIFAYREVGVPLDATYIIGDLGGDDGTEAVESYPAHLDAVEIPEVEQPWE